jgi:DNA polymerase-3 subunit epsilon
MAMENLTTARLIAFDVETTGFATDDCIIEIGAVEILAGRQTGVQFHSFVNAVKRSHPLAQRVHSIPEEVLLASPPIEQVLLDFLNWVCINGGPFSKRECASDIGQVGDSVLVAHNLAFDLRMLRQEV